MKRFSFLTALLLLSPNIAIAADTAPPAACELKRAASLDMVVMSNGEVQIPITVNGKEIRPIVDTGDIYSGITSANADALNLRRYVASMEQVLFGGIPIYEFVTVDSLKIGPMSGTNLRMMVIPSSALDLSSDGLIGGNLLSLFDIDFDFARGKFNMFSPDHCPGKVVYWTNAAFARVPIEVQHDDWHISVPVTLDGKPLVAVIDTGAYRTSMSMRMAKKLFGIDATATGMKSLGSISINRLAAKPVYRYAFSGLSFEGVTVQNPDIDIISDEIYGKDDPPMIIGINVLRQLHVYIAYQEQALYVTPAEAR